MSERKTVRELYASLDLPEWPDKRPKAPPIMVMDACTLVLLSTPISPDFFDPNFPEEKRPSTYLDLLRLLPKDVVGQIQIPDIVVKEFIGWNCTIAEQTGKTVSWQVDPWIEETKSTYPASKAFLEQALKGQDPLIKVVHSAKEEAHVGEIAYRVAQLRAAQNGAKPITKEERIFRQSALENLQYGEGKNFGEIQCVEHALAYGVRHDAPVVMVTEDRWAQKFFRFSVMEHPHHEELGNMRLLNARGLLQALKTSGIMKSVGIKPTIPSEEHTRYIENYRESERERQPSSVVDIKGNQRERVPGEHIRSHKVHASFADMVRRSVVQGQNGIGGG